uniref:HTH_Tnp_Tc3_2 domain-containing protein n=1 Tax=Caenorhabditis japonica TaxID=281687 RepID=A0A8R1E909_CAEJA
MVRPFGKKTFTVDVRKSIVRGHELGAHPKILATQFGCSSSQIHRILKNNRVDDGVVHRQSPGRPRTTSRAMDRNILRAYREDPRCTSTDIQVSVTSPNEPMPSRRTIRRRLQVAGLHGRRPVKKPLVRLKTGKLALNGLNSTCPGDLESGLITSRATNQSSICSICSSVPMSDGKTWRWICDGLGMLLRHFHGSIEENCWNLVPICVRRHPVEHNATMGKSKFGPIGHIANWFRRRRVDLLEWPSQSPDFNPIEHMWEELKRRLKGVRASNANQKCAQLEAAWKSIPMPVVQTLLDSMPRRCQAVIDAKGYPTKY